MTRVDLYDGLTGDNLVRCLASELAETRRRIDRALFQLSVGGPRRTADTIKGEE